MSRRGSKNPELDVERYIEQELANEVEKMMINRHKLMCPFPIPAMDLYTSLWTPAQHLAMEALRGTYVLKMHSEFRLIGCPGPDHKGIRKILITMDEPQPLPRDKELPFLCLEEGQRELIRAWMPEWLKLKAETELVVSKVKRIGSKCGTWGQVIRLWPDLQGFLGEYGADKVHKAKSKSPYPEGVLEGREDIDGNWRTNGVLKEEFRPEVYAPLGHMIAECLMMPEIDNLIHVGYVE